MDGDLLTTAVGAGGGVVAVWTLVKGVGKWIGSRGDKGEAEAATEKSQAKALEELICQLADLRARVATVERELAEEREEREKEAAARTAAEKLVGILEERCKALEERCADAEAMAARWEKRGELISEELRQWHKAGRPSTYTVRPPKLPKG